MPSDSEGAGARDARPGIGNEVSAAGRPRVEGIQRARLIVAMVEVVAEYGLSDASVARVVGRAGVSRRTFYELFEDREQCFLAAFDRQVERVSRYVLGEYHPDARWVERIRVALIALLCFLDAEPAAGWLLVVASLGAGPRALERRRLLLERAIAVVDEGRCEGRPGSELPPLAAEAVVGGALSVLHARLLARPPACAQKSVPQRPPIVKRNLRAGGYGQERLVALAGPLTGMIVLPYLGAAAARREIERPVPEPRAPVGLAGGDPLRGLGMRLTYRTVRVLMSVAAAPGSSNREVSKAAGIADQGQTSKLLGRLERHGLVRNEGSAPGKGAPNAWALTAKGRQIERVMGAEDCRQRIEVAPL